MNIFYLDHNPTVCAQLHVDKHVVKMVTETAQLLSTAHRVCDGKIKDKKYILSDERELSLYKTTHINHPCAIWIRSSIGNYNWLFNLFVALLDEYTYRYSKQHACARLVPHLMHAPEGIPQHEFQEPPQCMPDYCKRPSHTEGYRAYYNAEKSHMFSWKGRSIPQWVAIPQT